MEFYRKNSQSNERKQEKSSPEDRPKEHNWQEDFQKHVYRILCDNLSFACLKQNHNSKPFNVTHQQLSGTQTELTTHARNSNHHTSISHCHLQLYRHFPVESGSGSFTVFYLQFLQLFRKRTFGDTRHKFFYGPLRPSDPDSLWKYTTAWSQLNHFFWSFTKLMYMCLIPIYAF